AKDEDPGRGIRFSRLTCAGFARSIQNSDVCDRLVQCKVRKRYTEGDRGYIAQEIHTFGGNTLTNVYRDVRNSIPLGSLFDKVLPDAGKTIAYDEVVKDVASHLKVAFDKKDDPLIVEDRILRKILKDSFERMSDEERAAVLKELNVSELSMLKPATSAALIAAGRMGGFATYELSLIVANAVSKALLGRGLPFAVNATVSRTIGVLLGPVGWVVTGAWTLADMASPAYRVTVPCVIQIAYMRQKAIVEAHTKACPSCGARSERASRFCAECGHTLQGA
ncbi:ubiquinol-cytochrome C chaperone family protein, partial [Pandoraea anhela]|uniref:ubiquinol-cytochrome C chaperone family protein n=1 Tax=Pandoraea anhela TaxID=2508295 RepID=UPI0012418F8E